jgi:arylformamidase
MSSGRVHDITSVLGPETVVWPGDAPYQRYKTGTLADGAGQNLSALSFSAHAGTHLDAPAHFFAGGKTIDAYPPDRFVLPALVAEIATPSRVGVGDLERLQIAPREALLLKTANSARGLPSASSFRTHYTFLTKEAAQWCVSRRLGLVGIDYLSVDAPDDNAFSAHRALLGADVLILEGLDLSGVRQGRYRLLCLPLKLKGCEAAPVRAVLVED